MIKVLEFCYKVNDFKLHLCYYDPFQKQGHVNLVCIVTILIYALPKPEQKP